MCTWRPVSRTTVERVSVGASLRPIGPCKKCPGPLAVGPDDEPTPILSPLCLKQHLISIQKLAYLDTLPPWRWRHHVPPKRRLGLCNLYSGYVRFEARLLHRQFWPTCFVVFLTRYRWIPRRYIEIGLDRYVRYPTQLSFFNNRDSAVALAVSHWLPTAAARVLPQVRSCGIYGGQSGNGADVLLVL
jgi:hypothetical protein